MQQSLGVSPLTFLGVLNSDHHERRAKPLQSQFNGAPGPMRESTKYSRRFRGEGHPERQQVEN